MSGIKTALSTALPAALTVLIAYKIILFFKRWDKAEKKKLTPGSTPAPGCIIVTPIEDVWYTSHPTENTLALVRDSGDVAWLKGGEEIGLSGPLFSLEHYECRDAEFVINSRHVLYVYRS